MIFFKPKPSPTACGKKEDPDSSQQKSEKQSSYDGFSFWKPSPTRGDDTITDSEQCLELAKQLKRTESTIHGNFHTATKTNGERTSEQISIKVPYVDHYSACFGRKATNEEKKQFNGDKKNSK